MTDDELTEILRNYDLTDPAQVMAAIKKVAVAAEAKGRGCPHGVRDGACKECYAQTE